MMKGSYPKRVGVDTVDLAEVEFGNDAVVRVENPEPLICRFPVESWCDEDV